MFHSRMASLQRPTRGGWLRLLAGILLVALALGISPQLNGSVEALSPDIVISQVYGGGGNAGAPYKADYVELFNRGSIPVNIDGWSIQYAASTGTVWSKTDLPSTILQPGQYFLIKQNTDGTNGVPLPAPDLVAPTPVSMAAGEGKVALMSNQSALPAITCPLTDVAVMGAVVDFVGYGGANCSEANSDAPILSNTTAGIRNDSSCMESDNNGADFTAAAPNPRNTASPVSSCYPDTTIDNTPLNPSNDVNPSFTFSSADTGSTFACQLDGGGWAVCASPQNYTGLSDGSHTFEVRATNPRGNTDTTPAAFTWLIDVTGPNTTIDTKPADPSDSADAAFTFSADEPGSTFECRLDGGAWGACASPKNYTGLADGSHTFEVRATDPLGNMDLSPASYTWLIDTVPPDTTPPETTIDTKPADPSASGDAIFTFSADEPGSTFECRLDGGAWEVCASPKNYTGLADGSHTFDVRATDTANNTDPSPASYTWLIDTVPPDTTPPETTIDTKPADPSASADATFTFSADEPGSTFECRLDGGAWGVCASPKNYTGLADGSHTFDVRATDLLGNTDPSPASYSWTITTVVAPVPILISTIKAGSVGGVDYGADDILLWDGAAWSVWFDGSNANLTQKRAYHNINAFAVPDPNEDDVIIAFAQNKRHVPGIVPVVEGMDLVRWDGSAFSFFFDGSDVGLTVKTQEKIDGLHILPGAMSPINGGNCLHYLLISTKGPGKVRDYLGVNRRFGGEDVLGFCMTSEGTTTAGLWHLVLDGSAEGLRANSLVNLSASADGQVLYLTTKSSIAVDNAFGDPSMVFRFDFATGKFSGPFFSAPATGIVPALDGLQVMGELP